MSSQPPKTRPPVRRVSGSGASGGNGSGGNGDNGGASGGGSSQPPKPPKRQSTYYEPPPRRDPFPYVLGGILALLVVGIFVVVFLLSSGNSGTTASPTPVAVVPTAVIGSNDLGPVDFTPIGGATTVVNQEGATPAGDPPPRMPLADFKAMYDDPAQRANMLIIDVRAKESFDAGHIKGAESWPESDIDARVVKLPKDKYIVAYCQ
jgi:hypothetical protein